MTALHGSYAAEDVTFLLTPIAMPTTDIATKEALIQTGARHYSEMLSPETAPDATYMSIYADALATNGARLARHVNIVADALAARGTRVIASLARAGTPIGVLLARALRRRGIVVAHYSISIIRGRGIDRVALAHIVTRHGPDGIVFVDGWTGKGAIAAELRGADGARACGIEPVLSVIADPAGRADIAATADDYVIPSGILNGIVSGLVSRSVLNACIGANDFHGTVRLEHLARHDVSRAFVDTIDTLAQSISADEEPRWAIADRTVRAAACDALVARIASETGTADRNRIKPGIAEATRAVLRRKPGRLLLGDPDDPDLRHLVHLARTRGVIIERLYDARIWRAVAVIASVGGE